MCLMIWLNSGLVLILPKELLQLLTTLSLKVTKSYGTGDDKCAGTTPEYTQAECANTGMTAAQYGKVTKSPASQYYNRGGGNLELKT